MKEKSKGSAGNNNPNHKKESIDKGKKAGIENERKHMHTKDCGKGCKK